ncbi:hypothetical protein [Sphingomonas sp. PR090111-T3T-6A]|uniref:hypothetical protein n=1 Tax=Sphingomonas sp. PR090111-T3T-6A TaxID=685778 RepID=UPI000380067A|nr:hypothetical protein [Sphingomonas sp. PR090111-T3T-6A]
MGHFLFSKNEASQNQPLAELSDDQLMLVAGGAGTTDDGDDWNDCGCITDCGDGCREIQYDC